jgi:hypothetical protein
MTMEYCAAGPPTVTRPRIALGALGYSFPTRSKSLYPATAAMFYPPIRHADERESTSRAAAIGYTIAAKQAMVTSLNAVWRVKRFKAPIILDVDGGARRG